MRSCEFLLPQGTRDANAGAEEQVQAGAAKSKAKRPRSWRARQLGAGAPSSFPFASRSSPARSSCPHHSYKIGDAFLKVPGEEALQLLARDTERVDAQLARLEAQKEQCDAGMQELKVKLYAKFGKENISES